MYTHRLNKDTDLLQMLDSPFGMKEKTDVSAGYIRLPIGAKVNRGSFRLMIEVSKPHRGLLPLEIVDDVTIGRGSEGDDAPTLDLSALDAFNQGVSRRHAMLRPTPHCLYLIDLGSSNGTLINGGLLGKGMAHAIRKDDHISLGKLNMVIRYLENRSQTQKFSEEPPG